MGQRPDGQWEYSGQGSGIRRLIDHIEEYSAAERELASEYERARGARDYLQILERLGPLHHAARNLYATLQAAREAIPEDRDTINMRDFERAADLVEQAAWPTLTRGEMTTLLGWLDELPGGLVRARPRPGVLYAGHWR